ncbi:hypothetical protein [Actinoplanes sp. NPDC051859]|uniref:hypothetical protein n=1 Tax=Actinoplanes sp. NPDC051859 TaxID=3363909 RepID=UPI0037B88945
MSEGYNRIQFAGNGQWVAVSQNEAYRWAGEADQEALHIRVVFAALGRMNSLGHAQFGFGELARLIGTVAEGEVKARRRDSVSAAIKAAKKRGFIAPESNARCLVLRHYGFQKSTKDRWPCPVHDLD